MESNKNNNEDIFVKKSPPEKISLSKEDLYNSIPKTAIKQQNIELSKIKTEWRWRILKLPNKKNDVVEISFKKPNENRTYINHFGKWINDNNIEHLYDQHSVKQYVRDEFYDYT